jgi:hypothetical protein
VELWIGVRGIGSAKYKSARSEAAQNRRKREGRLNGYDEHEMGEMS